MDVEEVEEERWRRVGRLVRLSKRLCCCVQKVADLGI